MRNALLTLLLVALMGPFAIGCDSDSGSESDSIDGLWAFVTEEGDDEDILYIRISGNQFASYDFMGDAYDEGPDCYRIYTGTIQRVSGNVYRVDLGEEGSTEVTLRRQGNRLTVDFGGVFGTDTYSRSNRNVSEFVPECEEDDFEFELSAPLLKATEAS